MGQSVLGLSDPVLTEVAEAVGTPAFVYSADAIRERYGALETALAGIPHAIHYAVKANSNLAVLRQIHDLGAGADIVSEGELARVLEAGFNAGDVLFSGVGKSAHELAVGLKRDVGLINLESADELDLLAAAGDGRVVRVGIRVNPNVTTDTHPYTQTGEGGMKFGVPLDQVDSLADRIDARPNIRLVSIGLHIGSQIADAASYRHGADRLIEVLDTLIRRGRAKDIRSLDLGGGLGITYTDEAPIDLTSYADVVALLHQKTGLPVLLEPGRFLVGNAGVLLTRMLYRKHSGGRDFVIVDGGMNDFIRPALYQARHTVYVVGANGEDAHINADIVGPICESGDFLATDHDLPVVSPGDLIAIMGAGAYGFSMSSNYNSRPRAAEVMVDGGRFGVVRERETVEQLWVGETAEPRWVEMTCDERTP